MSRNSLKGTSFMRNAKVCVIPVALLFGGLKAIFRLSGAGKINAEDLKSAKNETEVSGNGKATVWATDELKVSVSGTGKVEYKGKPRLTQSVSDKGSLQMSDD
jgi:hypothetical protein